MDTTNTGDASCERRTGLDKIVWSNSSDCGWPAETTPTGLTHQQTWSHHIEHRRRRRRLCFLSSVNFYVTMLTCVVLGLVFLPQGAESQQSNLLVSNYKMNQQQQQEKEQQHQQLVQEHEQQQQYHRTELRLQELELIFQGLHDVTPVVHGVVGRMTKVDLDQLGMTSHVRGYDVTCQVSAR
jgi:hypothetical protein